MSINEAIIGAVCDVVKVLHTDSLRNSLSLCELLRADVAQTQITNTVVFVNGVVPGLSANRKLEVVRGPFPASNRLEFCPTKSSCRIMG